ncbi:hypothetical protein BGZ83_006185 [Gryganskiella cystojenkinii]|nr:hypothetical protein BGZ83_006185 [Gryganskiella cystojenkinii]
MNMTLLQSIPANPIVAAPADAEVVPTFMAAAPANPPAHPQPDDKLASHHGGDLPSPKRDLEERALDKRWETCRNQYQCMSHIAGADYTGWYQDCANKIAVQGGDGPWFGSAGNWPSGPGCACQYTSSFNGAWGPRF